MIIARIIGEHFRDKKARRALLLCKNNTVYIVELQVTVVFGDASAALAPDNFVN